MSSYPRTVVRAEYLRHLICNREVVHRRPKVCGTALGKHFLLSSTPSSSPYCYVWKKKEVDKKNGLRKGESRGVLRVHILPFIWVGSQMRAFVGATRSPLYGSERLQRRCHASAQRQSSYRKHPLVSGNRPSWVRWTFFQPSMALTFYCPLFTYSHGDLQHWKIILVRARTNVPWSHPCFPHHLASQTTPIPQSLPLKNISEHRRWASAAKCPLK